MAIYRTGQASMDAQGYITGYDTKWREQLTLIRPGATIFFIDAPFQAAVISEVISDTQIRAITTGGAEIGRSNYIILLHDSITVDGLAQDVAETLRYYQSKETQIEEAIEFLKNFDLKQLQDLANQVKGDAEKTANDRAATEQLKNDTQQVKDSAVAETNQIKSDTDAIKAQTQQIKDSAIIETEAIKQEAFGARDQAVLARDAAGNHAVDANNAKAGAETARDEARQWAQQVNPENLLHKDQNLNDVQDKGAARAALDVPAKSESFLIENNLSEIADRAAAWLNVRPIGSTPLAGHPVGDYDAATKRWVENLINSGSVGPTMNGVMNYGVGDFHLRDSREYINPYEVVSDGQLLNRADWPELWAYAQMLSPISDSDWLADPLERGKYSTGDGLTTFRVPDRNGVQPGSISYLFARGDGGMSSDNGLVADSSLPNITASMSTDLNGRVWFPFATAGGAMDITSSGDQTFRPMEGYQLGTQGNILRFNASKSSAVYGRYGNTDNVLPRSFVGVWVIRASGGFVAANTSWSVINGDKTAPSIGTSIKGGEIRSDYNIGGSMHIRSSMRADGNYSQRGGGVWRVEDFQGKSNEIQFNIDTNVIFPVPIVADGMNVISRSKQNADGTWPTGSPWVGCQLTNRVANEGFAGAQFNMFVQENVGVDTFGGLIFIGANTTKSWLFNQFGNAIAPGSWVSNSDRRIKKDIARIEDPLDKMRKIHGYSWRKLEGNQFGVGFIAQEVQELFPESVYEGPSRTMPDGTVVEGVLSPDTSGVAAALHHEAILAIMDQIEELKKEIAELKK